MISKTLAFIGRPEQNAPPSLPTMRRGFLRFKGVGAVNAFSGSAASSLLVSFICLFPDRVFAQATVPKSQLPDSQVEPSAQPEKYDLELHILIQTQPVYRVKAQEWGRALQEVGYTPQFRQTKPGEGMRVEDVKLGDETVVRVVGGMSADGSIQIRDDKFSIADLEKLKAVLGELAQFGAGGPPESNPRWGMTDAQLQDFTRLMSEPVASEVALKSPVITLESIGLPNGVRMKFTDAAKEKALGTRPANAPENLDLKGFSKGTAMAITLAQYGLGFRPIQTGPTSYELEIDSGNELSNLWPAGWKAQESSAVVLPAYLKAIPIDLKDVEVSALLQVLSDRLEVPVLQSTFELAAQGQDLDEVKYSRKPDRVSPVRLLTAIGDQLQLGFDLRVDEAGKLFLWATTKDQSTAFRTRFAHIKQK